MSDQSNIEPGPGRTVYVILDSDVDCADRFEAVYLRLADAERWLTEHQSADGRYSILETWLR